MKGDHELNSYENPKTRKKKNLKEKKKRRRRNSKFGAFNIAIL